MDRLALTALVVAVFGLCLWGMWRGWRRQSRAQSVRFPPFPPVPAEPGPVELELAGVYASSTVAGHWQERIVTRGAGVRSAATLRCHRDGIAVARIGAPSFWIPRESLVDVRTAKGIAGKVLGTAGLLVLTWRPGGPDPGEVVVDTGFRGDDVDEYPQWIDKLKGGARA
ncbi:hypothetical protein SAMN05421810_108197 [Amycolatopsis arida]|uniref:PH domain-containing protein n=1 Tax=Amycolatopsis arida TaxID=587909 RepID=A0A1I5Z3R1_9PSEU|nr:transporter [Amycolatopsis arida]TDX90109.1 hypothetical protein CLV69_108197 [Amycolatopsis arida]SFQ51091.1 hypothetical protein SAMN05421810_108197 [Amycolatopsis arida]